MKAEEHVNGDSKHRKLRDEHGTKREYKFNIENFESKELIESTSSKSSWIYISPCVTSFS